MIRAVVFDFDGVILESATIKTDAFAQVVADYPRGQAEAFVRYHMSHMGISRHVKFRYLIEEILKQPYSEQAEKELADRFSGIVFSRVMTCPFVPGAREFLERNHQKYDFYVASGTPEEELLQVVEGRGLADYFKQIYGTPMKKEGIVETICRTHGYAKEEMVFVGDASTDKNAAAHTGLIFIGRNTPENIDVFRDVIYRVDNLLQIEKIIGEM